MVELALNLVVWWQEQGFGEVYLSVVRVVIFCLELNLHLLQEVIERLHEIIDEVKLVMVHVRGHYDCRRSCH